MKVAVPRVLRAVGGCGAGRGGRLRFCGAGHGAPPAGCPMGAQVFFFLHGLGPARPEYVSEGAKGRILDGAALLRDGHRREAVRVEG